MMINRETILTDTRDWVVRAQWLDKLWLYLFDGESGGLMSPGQIRREHRDRNQVRQLEMASILEAEQDINGIHQGLKALDDNGNLVDTPPVDTIATHSIIENRALEQGLDLGLDSPAAMIRSVVKELSVRDLERSLNVRKIAIQAETEILASEIQAVNPKPVNAEWMVRWRESAENVFNPELQIIWARMLVQEIASPGSFSLGLMATLRQLSLDDLEMLRIVSKYAFEDFVYNASYYFNTDYHRSLFDVMEDLFLMTTDAKQKYFPSASTGHYTLLLSCHDKALQISASSSEQRLKLPILKLSRIGRQLLPLCGRETDLAYLFDLARYIKQQGFDVVLGDWSSVAGNDHFVKRMCV